MYLNRWGTGRRRWCIVIGNNGGEGKEMVRSPGGRSLFQRRGAVMDMARLKNMIWEVTGGWERVRQEDGRVEHCWIRSCFVYHADNMYNNVLEVVFAQVFKKTFRSPLEKFLQMGCISMFQELVTMQGGCQNYNRPTLPRFSSFVTNSS